MTAFRSLFLYALCTAGFAQTDGITVTASRTIDLSPDQITVSLAVLTDPSVPLDKVLQATQPLGLDASNLTTVSLLPSYGPPPMRTSLNYLFTFTTAFSKLGDINDKVAALRRSLADNTPSMDVQINSVLVSPTATAVAQARLDAQAQLIADAKQQGDQLAKAAGVSLGGVIGLNEFFGVTPDLSVPYYGPYGPSGPSALHPTYSLTVRFAVK